MNEQKETYLQPKRWQLSFGPELNQKWDQWVLKSLPRTGVGEALSLHGCSCRDKEGVCAVEVLRLGVDRFTSLSA